MPTRPALQTIDLPPLELRAELVPASINAEQRTVDVVFSTGAAIERTDVWTGEKWSESLSLDPTALRLERLNSGRAPFLNAHTAESVTDTLGVIQRGSARLINGSAVATIRLSKRADVEPVWADIQDGILGNVSVGYRVHKYERIPSEDAEAPEQRHAVDWEPYEISAVPMGADAGAMIRAARDRLTEPCLLVTRRGEESKAMSKGTPRDSDRDRDRDRAEDERATRPAVVEPDAAGDCPDGYELGGDGKCHERALEVSERQAGAIAERQRHDAIVNGAVALRYRWDHPTVRQALKEGWPVDKALTTFLDMFRGEANDTGGPKPIPSGAVRVTSDPLDKAQAGITGALLHRIDPGRWALDDNARLYRTYSVVRCAEEWLELHGVRSRHMSKLQLMHEALNLKQRVGYHTTADFATILGDVANKSLRALYAEMVQTWGPISKRVSVPDFRPITRLDFGQGPPLRKVLEHGEFTRGTIASGKETFQIATYGRIFAVTRQALVNDDLDAFGRMPGLWARSARNLESDIIWGEILANRVMSDGQALFSAAHANLITPGTLITIGSLGTARAMLARQKGFDGMSYLSLTGRFLIVPPGVETLADQYVTAVSPATNAGVNPFAGRLQVITEPRLEGGVMPPDGGALIPGDVDAWFIAASPDDVAIVEYGYLDGENGPALDTRNGFDIDGVEWKARLDFGAKVMDYRGLVKNEGATVPQTLMAQMNVPVVLPEVPVPAGREGRERHGEEPSRESREPDRRGGR